MSAPPDFHPASRFVDTLLRHRIAALVVIAAITAVCAVYATRVSFDSDIEIWFIDEDPALVAYRSFLDRFEADEIVVLGVFADDVFTAERLGALRRITDAADAAPWVHRARSLTNMSVAAGGDGSIDITPLVGEIPTDAASIAALKERVVSHRLLADTVAATDGRAAAVLVEMSADAQTFDRKVEMLDALRAIADAEVAKDPGLDVRIAGSPAFDDAFFRYMEADTLLMGPGTMLLIALVLGLMFRRVSGVLIPMTVVLLALTWLFGVLGMLGTKVDVVSTGLPAVVLAIGLADTIHVLSDYYQELGKGHERIEAIRRSLRSLLAPIMFTSATTAAGMLSLSISDLHPIATFGWSAALGVCFALLLSITLVPILLSVTPVPNSAFLERQSAGRLTDLLQRLARPSRRRAWIVTAVSLVMSALAVWGFIRLPVGANPMNYFRPSDPIVQDTQRIDTGLGGSASVELLIEATEEGLKEPKNLARIDRVERWMEKQPGVTKALSVADSLKEMNRVLTTPSGGDDNAAGFVLPDSRPLTAQLYLLLEGEDDFVTQVQDNYGVGRITARVQMSNAEDLASRIPEIERYLADNSDEELRFTATGYVKLMGDMEDYLLESQSRSFLIAFAVIILMLGILLRSVRLALFSMIPNFLPILIGVGMMSFVGIPLDPGTVMIGSIALGLVVDDTVHFMVRLRRAVERGDSIEDAVRHTVEVAGRPITITSIVLMCGFIVLAAASFTPNFNFGTVTAAVIGFALVADLVVLPAALILIEPKLERG